MEKLVEKIRELKKQNFPKTKLKYITIEDLKVSNMIKNRHLSKAISQQKFLISDYINSLLFNLQKKCIFVRFLSKKNYYATTYLHH